MYILLIVLHVIACLVLVFVVLLQAGRGGGMSDMIGGGQPQSLFGTQTNAFLMRATEVCAVMFIVTSLSLAIISTQRGKSLVARSRAANAVKQQMPKLPGTTAPVDAPINTPVETQSIAEDLKEASLPEGLAGVGSAPAEAKADAS